MRIIYLMLDAISYDDSWLGNKNLMPNLKNFSQAAKNFHNHYAVTHNTRGNFASIFFGASSSISRVMGRKQSFRASGLKTLQKILKENNYFTSYIGTQPLFHSENLYDNLDFSECIYLSPSMSDFYINAEKFNNYLFNKIEKINENSLLFLHYTDCHEPFETPDNILNKKDYPNIYKFHYRPSNILYRIPTKIVQNYLYPSKILKKLKIFREFSKLESLCSHPYGPINNPERYSGFYEKVWEDKNLYEEYEKMKFVTLKYLDKQLINILNFIKKNYSENTLIFFSSDHGNNALISPDFKKKHGLLTEKTTHIPLSILSFDNNLSKELNLNSNNYNFTSHTNFQKTILNLINPKKFQFYENSLLNNNLNNEFVISEVNDQRFEYGECILRNKMKNIHLKISPSDNCETLKIIEKKDLLNLVTDEDYDLYKNFKEKYNLSLKNL